MRVQRFIPAILVALFGLLLSTECRAANLTLHRLFSSHMIFQRDAMDPIWGWAPAGATVTVVVKDQHSTVIETQTSVAAVDGSWQVQVGPFGLVTNNFAYTITVSCPGQSTITLTDVLIGDVWLCTGQSNMQFTLNDIGVTNLNSEIADSINYPMVRQIAVPTVSSLTKQTNFPSGSWQVASPSTAGGFTATGYFTAREIYKQQHIPIGILLSAWAGSEIKSWLDTNFVNTISDFTQSVFDEGNATPDRDTISGPYNAMIAPLAPFRIKAVEWYQGEYNVSWPEQYSRLLPGLMSKWRSLFNQPNLPFVIIQLPNFGGTQTQPVETGSWAELREAQLKTVLNDANARIVTTIDIGHGDLHPTDKQDVGLRAARAAANFIYGQDVVDQAPVLTNISVSGNSMICVFDHVGAGLMVGTKTLEPLSPAQQVPGGVLQNFAVCGANKVYFAANAIITASNQVTVSSPSVSAPVAVRYAWGNNPSCNLYNKITDTNGVVLDGLPFGSQRTDPVNRLMVNWGTGSGYYALGAQPSIMASNLAAQTFDHWSGDTNLLSGVSNATVKATISQEYVSVLANYRITGAPPGVGAVGLPSQINVTWNPMAAVHFNIRRATTSGGPYTLVAPDLIGVSGYTDGAVTPGITYYYIVSATNLLGEGPWSAEVNTAALAGPPITTNTWDANGITLPNPQDGSGNWFGGSNWWNGSASVSGHWSNGSPMDSASFGAGTVGNYLVNLGGSIVYATNLFFTTSGYTLTNGTIYLLGSGTPLTVNANVTATLKNSLTMPVAGISLKANSGGTLSLAGGASFNGNIVFVGGGTVDFNAGTFAGANFALWAQTPITQEAAAVNTVRIMVGYGGNSTYTLNHSNAVATSTGGGGDSFVGRAGSVGTLTLKQGTIILTTVSGDNLQLGFDTTSEGTLSVEGGLLNLGGNILYINRAATSSGGSGTANISGGTVIAGAIDFGGGGTFSPGTTAALNISGGTLYLGAGGITNLASGSLAITTSLSGGTIGASAAWSSSLPLTLTNNKGNIIFQTADSSSNAKDIVLTGNLSGVGGLTKTGVGTLSLKGANSYIGGTILNAGTLSLSTTNNVSMAYTNNGGILNVRAAKPGTSLSASTLALSNNVQLTFDLGNLGNPTAPVLIVGDLAINGTVIVNVSNAPVTGTSLLLTYTGSRGGAGNFVGGTIPIGTIIIDDPINKKVSLMYPPTTPPIISTVNNGASGISFSGSNGIPFRTYRILCAGGLTTPVALWTPIITNSFDPLGNFSVDLPVQSADIMYFQLVTP